MTEVACRNITCGERNVQLGKLCLKQNFFLVAVAELKHK